MSPANLKPLHQLPVLSRFRHVQLQPMRILASCVQAAGPSNDKHARVIVSNDIRLAHTVSQWLQPFGRPAGPCRPHGIANCGYRLAQPQCNATSCNLKHGRHDPVSTKAVAGHRRRCIVNQETSSRRPRLVQESETRKARRDMSTEPRRAFPCTWTSFIRPFYFDENDDRLLHTFALWTS